MQRKIVITLTETENNQYFGVMVGRCGKKETVEIKSLLIPNSIDTLLTFFGKHAPKIEEQLKSM